MNESQLEQRLNERLREWRGPEPRPDFEGEVWRRIAAAPAPALEWFEALRGWFGVRTAWADVAAALIAVAIGLGSTFALVPPPRDRLTIRAPTLNGQTLAGTYLAMTSGGVR